MNVRSDAARRPVDATAPVAEVVAGMRAFALRLAATQPAAGNLVFSPMSIATAFSMVEAGAAERTAADIARVFDLPDQPDVHEAMSALAQVLLPRSDKVTLDVANAIWVQQGEPIGPPFLDTLAAYYGAGVETADFQFHAEAARQAINAWVAETTRDRIPELLPPGRVDALTLVAVVNAVYLDAPWRSPFDEAATVEEPFTLPDGSTVPVPTMHHPRLPTMATVSGDGSAAVKLFYEGSDLAMVVLLPPTGTSLDDYEVGLTASTLAGAVRHLAQADVDLALPRWDIATDLDLAQPLTSMGLRIPGGDLSGIVRDARIGAALHAATITVDEKRTVASAATAVVVERVVFVQRPHLQIRVDRPFLFVVQHERTGAPLFYGRVTDPRR